MECYLAERGSKLIRVGVLIISDKETAGESEDICGKIIKELVAKIGGESVFYKVIADQAGKIREELFNLSERGIADLILTTGGTGFAKRDVTPEATMAVIEKEVPGITELMRAVTARKTPMAYLSRVRAGIRKCTLIVNLPGDPETVGECLEAILPVLPHGIEVLKGGLSEHSKRYNLFSK